MQNVNPFHPPIIRVPPLRIRSRSYVAGASRRVLCAAAVLCLAILGNVAGCQDQAEVELAVWSEFLEPQEVAPHLEVLSQNRATLYLAIQPDDLGDELASLIRDARALDVDVHAWLQLPDMGIWVNERSAEAFAVFAIQYVEWADSAGVSPRWMIFDLEPPFEVAESLTDAIETGGLLAATDILEGNLDSTAFDAATEVLARLVDQLHARDIQTTAVILPWIIDDLSDGDSDLADAFETPLQNIAWDRISAILYRPTFAEFFGTPLSPGFVSSYATSLRQRFGDRVEIALGNIGDEGLFVGSGYVQTARIVEDLTAVRSAGGNRVSLFSLDGMVSTGGPSRWLNAATAPRPFQSQIDFRTALIRSGLGLFDRILDQ